MPIARLLATLAVAALCAMAQPVGGQMPDRNAALHDFDFLVGEWTVHHRRLKERLANNDEWVEFEGRSTVHPVMGGQALFDDNVLELPSGLYRAAGLRAFDPATNQWSIWWLDSRTPQGPLDPPVRGRFKQGVGTFVSDEMFNGKPIRVRYMWSNITPDSCHWEQAFSPDGGRTWETNWRMDFTRVRK